MKLLVSCLESSANLHFEQILNELQQIDENIEICGIFDEKFIKFGKPIYKSSEFSAMGFVGVVPLILKAKKALKKMSNLAKSCDHVLLIDSPAFNIPLLKSIKKQRLFCKVSYFVLPQVWAWKKGRAKILDSLCDNLASIWPFENKYYLRSTFVGHPLIDEISEFKTNTDKNGIVSFLPGSREAEIKALMPIFRNLAPKIKEKKLLVVPSNLMNKIDEIYGDVSKFEVVCGTQNALVKSDFAFICSGTATLEAALIGVPFVLCYKAKAIDVWLARRLVKLNYAGLANIIFDFAGKDPLHTELIQNEVSVENLLHEYQNYDDEYFLQGSKLLRSYLDHGSAKNVAKMIYSSINQI